MTEDYTTVIELHKLLNNDKSELEKFKQLASQNGWCFVNIPDEYTTNVKEVLYDAESFFEQPEENKSEYSFEPHYGYTKSVYKQGFRMLTGPYLEKMPIPHPSFIKVAQSMDRLAKDILACIQEHLFNKKDYEPGYDIPMAAQPKQGMIMKVLSKLTNSQIRDYGMLDIVEYRDMPDSDLNVAEHVDPGLFSISLKSTKPGLQMYHPATHSWVDVPVDQPVLWFGMAAIDLSHTRVRDGYHRVANIAESNRKTLWYEVCTFKQVWNNSVRYHGKFQRLAPLSADQRVVIVNNKTYILPRNATVGHVYNEIEKRDGLPPTKRSPIIMYGDNSLPMSTPLSSIPDDAVLRLR